MKFTLFYDTIHEILSSNTHDIFTLSIVTPALACGESVARRALSPTKQSLHELEIASGKLRPRNVVAYKLLHRIGCIERDADPDPFD